MQRARHTLSRLHVFAAFASGAPPAPSGVACKADVAAACPEELAAIGRRCSCASEEREREREVRGEREKKAREKRERGGGGGGGALGTQRKQRHVALATVAL